MATGGVNLGLQSVDGVGKANPDKSYPNPVNTLSKPSTRVFKACSEGKGWILRDQKGILTKRGKDPQVKIGNKTQCASHSEPDLTMSKSQVHNMQDWFPQVPGTATIASPASGPAAHAGQGHRHPVSHLLGGSQVAASAAAIGCNGAVPPPRPHFSPALERPPGFRLHPQAAPGHSCDPQ